MEVGVHDGLGCTISLPYVDEPECNRVAERFMRTLDDPRP
jgi:hypothetical protein